MRKKLYAQPNLPENVRVVRSRAFSAAHLYASRVCGATRWESMRHFLLFILYYPPNFLTETGIFSAEPLTGWQKGCLS
jgi:hypothetical protein